MKAIDGAESLLANIYFLKIPEKKRRERKRDIVYLFLCALCSYVKDF